MQRDRPDPVTNPPVQNIKRLLFGVVVVAAPKKRLVYFFCFFVFYFWGQIRISSSLFCSQLVSQSFRPETLSRSAGQWTAMSNSE